MTEHEFAIFNGLHSLIYAIVGLCIIFGVLRWFDKTSATPFAVVREKIMEDSLATAIYYSARILAVVGYAAACI